MKNEEKKTDSLTRTVSTIVFTNRVFLYFVHFAENTITIGVSAPPPKKKQKITKNNKFYKLKTGPSIS